MLRSAATPAPERKKAPSRGTRRPYEAQTNPPPVWKMDQARALTRCQTKDTPPSAHRTRIARPIFQMGNQGDLSKASPAACFFASFFAPKKEVRDCQGAHSPLIQFRGAPAGRCYTLRQHAVATLGYPSVTYGDSSPLRRGAKAYARQTCRLPPSGNPSPLRIAHPANTQRPLRMHTHAKRASLLIQSVIPPPASCPDH